MTAQDRDPPQFADRTTRRFPYEIQSRWQVAGAIGEVYAVLTDTESLPRWWPEA